jgi:putative ABC transport system ATP-binding protein
MSTSSSLLRESRDLLIAFAASIGHRIDSQRAERILNESLLNYPNLSEADWYLTVGSCAEALEFRIRQFDSNLEEAITLVESGLTVATLAATVEEELGWVALIRKAGNRILVESMKDGTVVWRTPRQLKGMLGLSTIQPEATWLVCYPILIQPSDNPESPQDQSKQQKGEVQSLPPFRRLFSILKAEVGDLWIVGIFSVIVGILTLTTPIAVEALVNVVAFGQFVQPVMILAFMVFVLLGFSATLTGLKTYVSEIIQRRLFVRLVEDLAYRLPRVQQSLIDHKSLPELTNRFLEIATIQKVVSMLLLDGIGIVMQTFIGMAVLAFYHPFLLGFDIVLLTGIAFTIFVVGRGAIKTSIKESGSKYKVLAWLEEIARNPTAFKLNDGTELAIGRADHLTVGYLDARKAHFRIVLRQVIFSLLIYCLATTVLLGLGGWLVIAGELSLGQLVASELIVLLIVGSFAKLGKHMESFYDLMAAVDKIGTLLDLPLEPHEKLLEVSSEQPFSLSFHDVSLSIAGKQVIHKLDFSIPVGGRFAVIGSGNSPSCYVVDLCLAIRQPDTGIVLLNGINIIEYRFDSLRESIGVAREIEVFDGKLEENIHLYRPQVSSRQVWWALETVGLLEVVENLPQGAQTILTEGGFPLTKMQARRLMLARAIVGGPKMIMIDRLLDAFSKAEARVLIEALSSEDWTLVVFTECDEIGELLTQKVKL